MKRYYIFIFLVVITLGCACNKDAYVPTEAEYFDNKANTWGANDKEPLLKQLKVMTYNIHYCEPPARPGTFNIEAIAEAINAVKPDIVFLQEVDNKTGVNNCFLDQSEEIRKMTQMNAQFFSARTRQKGYFGVAILSRFPMKEPQTYPLVKEVSTYEQRILATIKIDLPGVDSLLACNTHLEVFSADNRFQQLQEIIDKLSDTHAMPALFCGDFNTRPTDERFFGLYDNHFTRTCQSMDCPSTFDNPNYAGLIAIDHIGFKPKTSFTVKSHEVMTNFKGSDHFPVVAVLEFNR